jgi:hypothetical protein
MLMWCKPRGAGRSDELELNYQVFAGRRAAPDLHCLEWPAQR